MARYLTRSFAVGTVSRGQEISQLLGSFEEEGRRGLRWACVWPARRFEPIRVRLYEVEDLGPGTLPMDEFPAFHPAENFDPETLRVAESRRDDAGGRTVATCGSAEEAVSIAEREVGADPRRWVNGSVLLDEYNDYLEQSRPLGPWSPA
ncbi:hypothetical protein ACGFNU_46680 [Spirillospora sp. NPDC048911]|uniref:hypothetical protein n=1 Tax=Spirillospora sp. NPDC048911 TaxID=3364527 RepID=UPI0037153DDE